MKDSKGSFNWVFVLCIVGSITSLVGIPLEVRDRDTWKLASGALL